MEMLDFLTTLDTGNDATMSGCRNARNSGKTVASWLPDPVFSPIPPSGDGTNRPYFVNATMTKQANHTTTVRKINTKGKVDHNGGGAPRTRRVTTTGITNMTRVQVPYDKEHRGYYLVTTNYPWSVVLPSTGNKNLYRRARTDGSNSNSNSTGSNLAGMDHTPLPIERFSSSSFLQTTSGQAASNNCDIVATNGGPFDEGGVWNSGPTVRNGKLIRTEPNAQNSGFVGFGIAFDSETGTTNEENGSSSSNPSMDESHRGNWIIGTYGQLVSSPVMSSPPTRKIWDFVTGFEWLVYNGTSWVSNDCNRKPNPTGALRAPRTAVGLDKDSNLMVLVVDGCRHCLRRKGLALEELANLLVELGAIYAINMDGGGSSTMVMPSSSTYYVDATFNTSRNRAIKGHTNFTVINSPTCLDLPFPHCQRAVATVLCVSSKRTK
mmetsp:Transcript_21615/g.47218  ORF Transcript_21615/g.47218 Transcript_21615/m.47218 type:complete len:435 (+) Transcript_21615:306-1610(+)